MPCERHSDYNLVTGYDDRIDINAGNCKLPERHRRQRSVSFKNCVLVVRHGYIKSYLKKAWSLTNQNATRAPKRKSQALKMGSLQLAVTWYKIRHAGEQAVHWDIQNKATSSRQN